MKLRPAFVTHYNKFSLCSLRLPEESGLDLCPVVPPHVVHVHPEQDPYGTGQALCLLLHQIGFVLTTETWNIQRNTTLDQFLGIYKILLSEQSVYDALL